MSMQHIFMSFKKNKELVKSILDFLLLRHYDLKIQIGFHWKTSVGHSTD